MKKAKKTKAELFAERAKLLARIAKGDAIRIPLATKLAKLGLVAKSHVYERCEWGRVVARLQMCVLTKEGERVLEAYKASKPS